MPLAAGGEWWTFEILAETLSDIGDSPPILAEEAETVAAVDDCVGRLPAELRRIVEQRYVADLTTRAIAAAEGISEATVRNRLAEARGLLAGCLVPRGCCKGSGCCDEWRNNVLHEKEHDHGGRDAGR